MTNHSNLHEYVEQHIDPSQPAHFSKKVASYCQDSFDDLKQELFLFNQKKRKPLISKGEERSHRSKVHDKQG